MADEIPTTSQIPVDEAPIDETPISPSRPNAERKNSLVQHLKHRPERAELVQSMKRPLSPVPIATNQPPPHLLSLPCFGDARRQLG
jgi:hypothetical protein